MKPDVYPSWMQINWQPQDFTSRTRVILFVVIFCGVEIDYWAEGDYALKEHRRLSPSCGFAKGLWVGNILILSNNQPEKSSQQPNRSHDVCRSHYELKPNSLSERSKYY